MARKKAQPHHGGAWKVAYADFVTALMALFMVLWISAQDEKILIATSKYFQTPFRSVLDSTNGVMPFDNNKSSRSNGEKEGDDQQERTKQIELTFLNSVAADFYRLLRIDQNLADQPIDIQITTDGLRITLFDRARRPLFEEGTTEFTEWGRFVMQNIAWVIDRHHFRVTIDGHTRAGHQPARPEYSDWELSADRANAARRSLVHYAVDAGLIERVTGYAATKPLDGQAPEAESNQRVTLSLSVGTKANFKNSVLVERPAPAPVASTEAPAPTPTMVPAVSAKPSISAEPTAGLMPAAAAAANFSR